MTAYRSVTSAVLLTCLGVLPVFLLGALAPLVAQSLGFAETDIGLTVAAFFLVSAISSSRSGRMAERLGGRRSGGIAAAMSVTALLGVALVAWDWLSLTAFVAVGGVGNALGQVSSNLVIARGVPPARFGLAYGLKQAAVPTATLLGGLSVPLIGLTVGWRWAFALGTILAIGSYALAPPDRVAAPARTPAGGSPISLRTLAPLALAAGLGAGAANCLGSFFVASATNAGLGVASAGLLLAIGGAMSAGARIAFGIRADRGSRNELRTVAIMLGFGALAGLLMATVEPRFIVLAVPIGFALGWGWNGLLNLAVVRNFAQAPAAATGVTQGGLYVGGVIGPAAFALLTAVGSYPLAWTAFTVSMAVASIIVTLSVRQSGVSTGLVRHASD